MYFFSFPSRHQCEFKTTAVSSLSVKYDSPLGVVSVVGEEDTSITMAPYLLLLFGH